MVGVRLLGRSGDPELVELVRECLRRELNGADSGRGGSPTPGADRPRNTRQHN